MTDLTQVLSEIEERNFDADLGGHVQKNALNSVTKAKEEAAGESFVLRRMIELSFIYGYAKNQKNNIGKNELVAFKRVAEILLNLSRDQIENSIKKGTFVEVMDNE